MRSANTRRRGVRRPDAGARRTTAPFRAALACTCIVVAGVVARGGLAAESEVPVEEDRTVTSPTPTRHRPFGVGENLVYELQYGPIKAGTATLAVDTIEDVDDLSCYRFSVETRSNRVFSMFYKVRDRIESFMDVGELVTRRTTKKIREGDYQKDNAVTWDQEGGSVTYDDGTVVDIENGTRDVLGAFYYVRTLEMRVGDRIPLACHDSEKTYPLWIEVLAEETIDTPLGRFDCLVVEPKLQTEGLFRRTGSLEVWLTNDERRIPVMMKSKIPVGAVAAVLVKHERGREHAEITPVLNAN